MILLYKKRDKIATITLNRPEVMNAINLKLADELFQSWEDFAKDPQMRVLIITGAGDKAFCSGADLKERSTMEVDLHTLSFWDSSFELPMKSAECYKPVIAAINGHCLAGGLELALVGDIRIASENATFGQSEINWGILPGMGATQRLPRILPYNLAAEILFTGQPVGAEQALRIGLINRVVPLSELMNAAYSIAEILSQKSPFAIRAIKEALLRSYDLPLEQGLRFESYLRRIVAETEAAREGIAAFKKEGKS